MHELERSAERVLASAIQGDAVVWHEWRQAIAATWALKTAMMVEHADAPPTRTIPRLIYPPFRQFLRPTTMTQVWAADHVGENPHPFGHAQLRAQVVGPEGTVEPDDAEPYVLVVGAGQLVFWIVGHLVQGAALYRPKASITSKLIPIWPVRPEASWPPSESIVGDDGLRELVLSVGSP
jgi:hypothetical protein